MAALDALFKDVAKQVVADLGSALNTTITYTRRASPSYNTTTGALPTTDTAYSSVKVPLEFIQAEEIDENEKRRAKIYITPNLIGSNQPTTQDEISLTYAGGTQVARVIDVKTYRGGQEYLYVVLAEF